ncbi:MAG: diguanylate cyclase [Cyanobacteria bacterium SZAS LIN-3]|nr:diguanylate cyclase [Cyanobacteria bacterium SZAS LIN-3]MBS2005578.1 diguanylate cyclase [Cyanobacteria bacterium SZAS TMP-1]
MSGTEHIFPESPRTPSREKTLDAVEKHICQVLGFDFGFVDVVSGHEIINLHYFSASPDEELLSARKFAADLIDENKQPLAVANTLTAQKVKQTQKPWVGRAFIKGKDNGASLNPGDAVETEEFPYVIIPVLDDHTNQQSHVIGLLRIISFDSSREISNQDISNLRSMGEQLASRSQVFQDGFHEPLPTLADKVAPEHRQDLHEREQVLILHSNRVIRRRFSRILSERYRVLESDSEEKSLELLSTQRIDMIIVDSNLSGTSGFGFCKVIKESPQWKQVPVLIVTPDTNPTARVEGLQVGADDCLSDSCFDAELLARVQSSIRHLRTEKELAVQLQLLEDYAQKLETAHEQLSQDRQSQVQRNNMLEQLRRDSEIKSNQDSLLHRISNTIRSSFAIKENLGEMLEELSGWFSLDCCFIVLPSDEEPDDAIRLEFASDDIYKVIEFDRDLKMLDLFSKNFNIDQTLIVNDVSNDKRLEPFRQEVLSGYNILSLFILPVYYNEKLLGILTGYRGQIQANWNRINEGFLKSVADQVASGVTNARLYARVQRQATTDGLTQLFNHRTGQEKLTEQLRMAERYGRSLAVVMIDVDHFKQINDNFGHPVGDTVLKAVARLIKSNCRDVDLPIRYGGEEFLVVLPEVNKEGAHVVAERIRKSLAQEVIKHESISLTVTASLGIATFPEHAMDQHHLLELADKALYLSKRLGRNQVHTASDLNFDRNLIANKESAAPRDQQVVLDEAKAKTEDNRLQSFEPPTVSADAQTREELVPEVVEMVKTLAQSLYSRSDYNKQHHLEVARMSELLAKVMGLSGTQIEQIRLAGLLHDVGTLRLPTELLAKEGFFTQDERNLINQHPMLGADLLRPVRALKEICEIMENHHERWDGLGYPRGLKGEEIPLPARIVSIVDSYHAMISDRPYRTALTPTQAIQALKDGAGKQWDPFLVDIFIAVLANLRQPVPESEPEAR